jgi:hypothetical protein
MLELGIQLGDLGVKCLDASTLLCFYYYDPPWAMFTVGEGGGGGRRIEAYLAEGLQPVDPTVFLCRLDFSFRD